MTISPRDQVAAPAHQEALPPLAAPRVLPPAITLTIGRTLGLLLTILAGAAVAYLAWQVLAHVSHVLLLLVLAVLVAFIFAPLVDRLERRGLPRLVAIALAYLGSLGLLTGLLALLLGPLVAQAGALAEQVPNRLQALRGNEASLDEFFGRRGLPVRSADLERQVLARTEEAATTLLGSTVGLLTGLAGFVVDAFLVLVLSFYILLDSTTIHNNLLRLLPERWRAQAFLVEAACVKVVGGYIRGQLVMALTIGVAAAVGCWLLGVPYPLVVGLLAGLFELVPMLGPILAAVPAVLISLTQPFPLVLWVIVFFIVIQQIEANVIGPKITGHAVGLHPLGAMLALLAGVELGGLVGALFAVPVAGILYVLAVAVYWQWQGQTIPAAVQRPRPWTNWGRSGVHRRTQAPAEPGTAATAGGPIVKAAATAATAGGDTVPRPETLVSLEHQAQRLQDRFEADESARQAEQVQAVAETKQAEEARQAGREP